MSGVAGTRCCETARAAQKQKKIPDWGSNLTIRIRSSHQAQSACFEHSSFVKAANPLPHARCIDAIPCQFSLAWTNLPIASVTLQFRIAARKLSLTALHRYIP
jgi:hypothetical protein